jgi:hypothetical protein
MMIGAKRGLGCFALEVAYLNNPLSEFSHRDCDRRGCVFSIVQDGSKIRLPSNSVLEKIGRPITLPLRSQSIRPELNHHIVQVCGTPMGMYY